MKVDANTISTSSVWRFGLTGEWKLVRTAQKKFRDRALLKAFLEISKAEVNLQFQI
jgi:hypothetical protein